MTMFADVTMIAATVDPEVETDETRVYRKALAVAKIELEQSVPTLLGSARLARVLGMDQRLKRATVNDG